MRFEQSPLDLTDTWGWRSCELPPVHRLAWAVILTKKGLMQRVLAGPCMMHRMLPVQSHYERKLQPQRNGQGYVHAGHGPCDGLRQDHQD